MNESTFESMSIIQPLIPLPAHPKGRAMVSFAISISIAISITNINNNTNTNRSLPSY